MKLSFSRVDKFNHGKIDGIYKILKKSGQNMYNEKGLYHWLRPYPINLIKEDCEKKEVFIAQELETMMYLHTFQLRFYLLKGTKKIAEISKFATLPEAEGKGIGKRSMNFIEDYCRDRNTTKITLEVYDKSINAINFYLNRGFIIIGSKPTNHFTVNIMEKEL